MACEDYPCCGHELGDCEGLKYGSDESIKAQVERDWATGHGMCDHEEGIYNCDIWDGHDSQEDEDETSIDDPSWNEDDDYTKYHEPEERGAYIRPEEE